MERLGCFADRDIRGVYQQATDWHKRQPSLTPDTVVPPTVEGKPDTKPKDAKVPEESKESDNKESRA
jgi:hypothetical protein